MVIAMAAPTPPPSRPLRGSRLSSFYPSQPSEGPSLSSLDSAFQLQEYISLLIRRNPHDVDAVVSIPERSKLNASGEEKPDEGSEKDSRGEPAVDEACWIYEQLRRLAQDLSHPLITLLQQECTRQSCPEMKAGEWLYLCVAHGNDGAMEQCCAIDYILHTLDSATALLNSPRTFPSRISIPATSVRHFSSLARRLGRIFAHAYFHHREAFEQSEAESSLYSRFLALTSKFNLVPAEFLVIPPRMSASQQSQDSDSDRNRDVEPPRLLAAHPHSNTNAEHQERQQQQPPHPHQQETQPSPVGYDVAEHPHPHPLRELSPEKPSPIQGSPRKFGRNRTDTMIFSDAAAIGEELRAQEPSPERLESRHGAGIADVRTHSVVEDVGKDASGGEEVVDDEEEIQSPMEIPDETSPVADKIAPEPTHTDEAQADTAPPAPEVAQQDPISAGSGDTEALLHQSELVMLAESKDVCDESVEDSPCASQPSTTATTTEDPNPTAEPESKEEGLPQTQDLVMLAESEQTCDPSKHPLDLKDDAPSEASSSAATTAGSFSS
ncbi:Mob1/phocein [Rickenella mellea]|uniref:Mob1/phocein n=1 Tax=Rickenella mellea TaxID=50990 RepID=A0A4Y7PW12_9AGAM|nr:Mob1/phocein [Rickenella mellea]